MYETRFYTYRHVDFHVLRSIIIIIIIVSTTISHFLPHFSSRNFRGNTLEPGFSRKLRGRLSLFLLRNRVGESTISDESPSDRSSSERPVDKVVVSRRSARGKI